MRCTKLLYLEPVPAIHDVDAAKFLNLQREERLVLLDVRSPGEYEQGHILGAASLPLFDNDERARVGTTYTQVDQREALLQGLDIVGPKMRWLVEEATRVYQEAAAASSGESAKVGVYCWRGGSRSAAVAWLLDFAGIEVIRLEGGYKAYRQHIRAYFDRLPFDLRVVDGSTGSGKTLLLQELASRGAQVLDLEAIANHKGSAFGLTPGTAQPSTEAAENQIFTTLLGFDAQLPVWVENESRNIGKVFLPDGLVAALARGHRVELAVPLEDRVAHIVEQYGTYKSEVLADTFHHLRKRLGGKATRDAIAAVDAGDLHTAAQIALTYYDKAYAHYSLRQGHPSSERHQVGIAELASLAQQLLL